MSAVPVALCCTAVSDIPSLQKSNSDACMMIESEEILYPSAKARMKRGNRGRAVRASRGSDARGSKHVGDVELAERRHNLVERLPPSACIGSD